MKYLVLLLIVLVVLWRLRSKPQVPDNPSPQAPAETPAQTVEMQACTHCGVHVPYKDMLVGTQGRYCSAAHRTLAER